MMAGIDGIKNKIDPGEPLDTDLYELSAADLARVESVPPSLEACLDALDSDHAFLLDGGVFTEDVVQTYISYKRESEVDQVRMRPHPWEFALYHDA
jgi:glutamine synthetase